VQADLARILATLNPAIAQQQQQQQHPLNPQIYATPPFPPQNYPLPLVADPRLTAPTVPTRPDPRTITTLPAANRYITRHLSSCTSTLAGIRSLKSWQHAKERSWYSGRQELLKRHRERPENEAKLAVFLQSVGQVAKPNPRNEQQELRDYDATILEKSRGMVREMEREMNRLGIPLFCEGVDYQVDEATLGMWRRRVVELLEDLCE
ncbi:hypothetical protein BDD12DRAFT_691076, partial [Trichophaea hybrida]